MQIPYINGRLVAWADWVIRGRNAGRNGYPGQAAFSRLTPRSEAAIWSPTMDVEAEEVEMCVLRLQDDRRHVIQVYYLRTGTADMAARACGCCKKTLFNKVDLAHQDIMGMLNDLAAGIRLPDIDVKILAKCVDTGYTETYHSRQDVKSRPKPAGESRAGFFVS